MNVEQAIDELSKVEDKSQPVYYVSGDRYFLVRSIEIADEDSDKPKLVIS